MSSHRPAPRAHRGPRRPQQSRRAPVRVQAPLVTKAPMPAATSFQSAGLPTPLTRLLTNRGITTPFAIQAAVLPDALAGHDVLGRAPTGSGKTLAFGLPLLARVAGKQRMKKRPRVLVLLPTRELAEQVGTVLAPLGQTLSLEVATVYGGTSIGRQITRLVRGVDVLVATPGRLIDLMERGAVSLDSIEIAVLDEADHLCDLGFLPVMKQLLDLVPAGGQRMLFSATLDGAVDVLVRRYLNEPVLVEVDAPETDTEPVTHRLVDVRSRDDKPAAIADLVRGLSRSIVFVRTKHGADRLAKQLSRHGVDAGSLHGGLAQNARTRALAAFSEGRSRVLVATDVAARGLHVDGIELVIHADLPTESKVFSHRSGRTGRAGATGEVVTLVLPEETGSARRLLAQAQVSAA